MEIRFACKNLGMRCGYIAKGRTIPEVLRKIKIHGKDVHGLAQEDLPAIIKEARAAIQKV